MYIPKNGSGFIENDDSILDALLASHQVVKPNFFRFARYPLKFVKRNGILKSQSAFLSLISHFHIFVGDIKRTYTKRVLINNGEVIKLQ